MSLIKWVLPILIGMTALVLYGIVRVENWGWWCLITILVALIGTKTDAKPISWAAFLPAGLATLAVFFVIYNYANPMWHHMIGVETDRIHHIFKWNDAFNRIPFNDGRWFRLWKPHWLTIYMRWVYEFGFTLSYWICIIRAFFTKDARRLGQYALAGYLLQVPLILPFYNTILLQEVWYVQGTPDLMDRGLGPNDAFMTALNCFPSMHTSIAFAAILLAMREKSRWYRVVIGLYGTSIIISTLYLKIHWVLDVAAGMLFAYGCVKLSDGIVRASFYDKATKKFESFGERLLGGERRVGEAKMRSSGE